MKSKFFSRHSRILALMTTFLICFMVAVVVYLTSDISSKRAQLQQLEAQLEEIEMENSEIEYLINEADEAELFEHLARDRGYVYPDEKIFYNVTPGN
ncbi:MAG: septum formation initiator family protein [Oscillospiraceae bacterium]|nr:septum formation initiator family protein [Oscillospiraceae bacterium]